eukprot:5258548-Alexandrium_andersonii.AAC.1
MRFLPECCESAPRSWRFRSASGAGSFATARARCWCWHWVLPLHKHRSPRNSNNYCDIQLTAQISKAMERFSGDLFLSQLQTNNAFGRSQFAYSPGRGARDAVLFFLLVWLSALAAGRRVA